MNLNRNQALLLNGVLSKPELKLRGINGESYVKLLYLKRKIRNAIDALVEDEQQTAKEIKYDPKNEESQKDFTEKLSAIQKKFEVHVYEPFLSLEEFKGYVEMLDTESASIVAEFLLKEFKE